MGARFLVLLAVAACGSSPPVEDGKLAGTYWPPVPGSEVRIKRADGTQVAQDVVAADGTWGPISVGLEAGTLEVEIAIKPAASFTDWGTGDVVTVGAGHTLHAAVVGFRSDLSQLQVVVDPLSTFATAWAKGHGGLTPEAVGDGYDAFGDHFGNIELSTTVAANPTAGPLGPSAEARRGLIYAALGILARKMGQAASPPLDPVDANVLTLMDLWLRDLENGGVLDGRDRRAPC
jgi:hypothetical protein